MFHSKSDIFSPRWTAVIFQGRNQQYGAYVLRREAAADLTKALFSGIALFLLLIAIPIIARHLKPAPDLIAPPRLEERVFELMPPEPIDKTTPPPPAVAPPPPPQRPGAHATAGSGTASGNNLRRTSDSGHAEKSRPRTGHDHRKPRC